MKSVYVSHTVRTRTLRTATRFDSKGLIVVVQDLDDGRELVGALRKEDTCWFER